MAIAYATIQEMFRLALAAPAFVAYARPFDAVDATTATIRIKGHGLATGDTVTFELGESSGYLPPGITEFSAYAVTVLTADLFRINAAAATCYHGVGTAGATSLAGFTSTQYPLSFTVNASNQKLYWATPVTAGAATAFLDGLEVDASYTTVGAYRLYESTNLLTGTALDVTVITADEPIAWTNAGEGWGVVFDPMTRLQAIAVERSAYINEHLIAHGGKIDPDPITGEYPPVLVGLCARLTARQAIASLSVTDPQYKEPVDRLLASEADDKQLLADWKKGKPISPYPTDETPGVVENAARASSSREEMPWTTGSFA